MRLGLYDISDLYKGHNNKVKARTLYYLSMCPQPVNVIQLSDSAQVSKRYLNTRLPQFARWKSPYVLRKLGDDGLYYYRIAARGRRFVHNFIPEDMKLELKAEFAGRFN